MEELFGNTSTLNVSDTWFPAINGSGILNPVLNESVTWTTELNGSGIWNPVLNETETPNTELNGSETWILTLNGSQALTPNTSFLGAAYFTVGFLVMVSNGVVMYVIVTSRQLHLPPLLIIAFMAMCDFLFGSFVFVFYMPAAIMWRFPYPESFKLVSFCIHSILLGQTLFNVALANMDRYIAIGWPLVYSRIVTPKRLFATIVFLILVGCTRVTMIFLTNATTYYDQNIAMSIPLYTTSSSSISFRNIAVLIIPLVTLLVIVFCVFRICVLSRRSVSAKFPKMTLLCTGVYFLSYMCPTVGVICLITGLSTGFLIGFIQFAVVILYLNSLWNVCIYTITYTPFREALVRTFCYSYHRRIRQKNIVKMLAYTRVGNRKDNTH